MNIIKHSAIGVLAGSFDYFLGEKIYQFCSKSSSSFCLKPDKFFDPENLNTFSSAVHTATTAIQNLVLPLMPSYSISASNCHMLLKWNSQKQSTKDLIEACCSSRIRNLLNVQTFLSGAITEEFTDRYLLQTIALPFIAKLLPERIGKPLISPAARILITSIFFAITHFHKEQTDVTTHFVSGILFGFLFEKYGFVAATAAHFVGNLYSPLSHKRICENQISEHINFLNIGKALFR